MAKKKRIEAPRQQSERFREEVERMIAAGELSPTEAASALDVLIRKAASDRPD